MPMTNRPLRELVARMIALRAAGQARLTLLAVCPNSEAVLEAAVAVAARAGTPMLFAATLNQVDCDGGYTGWTPADFVRQLGIYRERHGCRAPLYPCLDHGGPWLKDQHTRDRLSLDATLAEVRQSLTACLVAGYRLLHVDATVDRTIPPGQPVPIDLVIERTAALIEHCERVRRQRGLPPVDYEVGTEEVHGGLVDPDVFARFLAGLRAALDGRGLLAAWPCFVVGKVGTDLHTTSFDPAAARLLRELVSPLGSLPKGHYTDWVENPEAYPETGMGGANVGPEFTTEECLALRELERREVDLLRAHPDRAPSRFGAALEGAVLESGRWRKWLQPEELGRDFAELAGERREWLVQTGARYVWTAPGVREARARLYGNLALVAPDPHRYVVDRVARAVGRYVTAFRLFGSADLLAGG